MTKELEKMLELARTVRMTPTDKEKQRRSFAYGNTHFENERITKETIDRAAEDLKASGGSQD